MHCTAYTYPTALNRTAPPCTPAGDTRNEMPTDFEREMNPWEARDFFMSIEDFLLSEEAADHLHNGQTFQVGLVRATGGR